MKVRVGTFNLNNLFSRYNFTGEIEAIREEDTALESDVLYEFGQDSVFRIRRYKGRLVKGKNPADTAKIASRIDLLNLDVLAVQEVEDVDVLREFNRSHLQVPFENVILVEGNDPRLIDVGISQMERGKE
jgi:predicted extracellular nuclease